MTLRPPIDPTRDHVMGAARGIDLLEYGDFECPYCRAAYPAIRDALEQLEGAVRFAFRHFPIAELHPHAARAAEAAEASAAHGRFWEMHDLLFDHQDALGDGDLRRYAAELELDEHRFTDALVGGHHRDRISADIDSGRANGVAGTPALFINGRRYRGFYDVESLVDVLEESSS